MSDDKCGLPSSKARCGQGTSTVPEEFSRALCDFSMLGHGPVLVALSGGADSTALLILLDSECKKRNIPLFALHVNHGIRGDEALRDENFCRALCDKYGILLFVEHINVPAIAEATGTGLEECARNERYRLFDAVAKAHGAEIIATAHNADDNLETMLFSLARGAGTQGLAGIPPVRKNIVRPLIYCTKAQIVGWLDSIGEGYVTDSTNSDKAYTRNFIRADILPLMRKLNPKVAQAATRCCAVLRDDLDALSSQAKAIPVLSRDACAGIPDAVVIRRLSMEAHESMLSQNITGSAQLPYGILRKLLTLFRSGRRGERLSLPGGIDAVVLPQGRLAFEATRGESTSCENGANEALPASFALVRGRNDFPGLAFRLTLAMPGDKLPPDMAKNIYKYTMNASVRCDKITGELYLRTRLPGDSYRFGGHTRSLRKLLQTLPLTERERAAYPLVCDGDGIVWAPGFRVREGLDAPGGDILHLIAEFY